MSVHDPIADNGKSADVGAARAYEKIKIELSRQFPDDKNLYYATKDPVFDVIYAAAEQWARANDWIEPPPD